MSETVIEANELVFKTNYYNSSEDKPFNFKVNKGEVGVIFNGKIASQLGRLILGKGDVISGELNYHPDIEYSTEHEYWKQNVGFCFREKGVFAAQTVYQNVNLPVKYYYQDEGLTAKALLEIEVAQRFWDLRPHLISWPVRKKILIARSAVLNPKFIFLDEPMALLDLSAKQDFYYWVMKQKEKGTAILMGIDEVYTGLIWADWILNKDNESSYKFDEMFSENQYKISSLLKEEFLKGDINEIR
jgi:ABC-type sugar transport system ATPase subunit